MAGMLNQNILRLQIPVHNAHAVKLFEGAHDFSKVKTDDKRRKNVVELPEAEDVEVAARAIRGGPTEIIVSIAASEEVRQERVWRFLLPESVENRNFPPGTAVGVGLDGQEGLLDDLEGEWEGCRGII